MPLLSHPYDAIRATAAYIIVRRNQEVSGQKRCETALEVLFYLNVSENGVCHWRKRDTRLRPKPIVTHGACSNLWVLSHTEMDTLEALANKSQITGPQYDDVTSWPSGLGNVCQCMPTSVVGGFKYFVVIIAPLLRWESATIHIPIGSVARGRQPCLDQIEDPNLRCLLPACLSNGTKNLSSTAFRFHFPAQMVHEMGDHMWPLAWWFEPASVGSGKPHLYEWVHWLHPMGMSTVYWVPKIP